MSPAPAATPPMPPERVPLREVALLFLKLSVTSFGGPAAHVARMEQEVVRRRGWLTHAEFLDLLGAAHLIPGPNSTELAIHIGARVAGTAGLLAAGACFILPAAVIVGALAWLYAAYNALPPVAALLYGLKPVVIAIVAQALWHLGRVCLRSPRVIALAAVAAAGVAAGGHELIVLFAAGFLAVPLAPRPTQAEPPSGAAAAPVLPLLPLAAAAGTGAGAVPVGLAPLFGVFAKTGAVLFGSGYVLLAFLRADLVERYGWMTEEQLLDAVAVGQVTPGPVFTTATFIGYQLAGWPGAVVATAGIFLPAFVFVALSIPVLPRLRRSRTAGAFLDGVNAASLALMAVVTVQLGRAALVDLVTVGLAVASAVLLIGLRVPATGLILAGGVVGLAAGG